MSCTCKVGPGKFEGEGALTYLLYCAMLDGDGTQCGKYTFFEQTKPGEFIQYSEKAQEYGYCAECVLDALRMDCYGAALWESEQGFAFSCTYNSRLEFDEAYEEAGEEEEVE